MRVRLAARSVSGFLLVFAVNLTISTFRTAALAQTTGDIRGTVADAAGAPLPGATVEIRSPSLLGTRSSIADADGVYRFPAVPPGAYTVTARLSGFVTARRADVLVQLSETVVIPFKLEILRSEEVVVSAEVPAVDTVSTTTGTSYTAKVMAKLPLGRNYADVVRLQPGVQEDMGATQGRSLALSIYGSTSAENLFLIDGVNTTNVRLGVQGKAINPEFIQELEVKAGGYQAEYGRNTGGVVNVITKQGGNEFHGDVFGFYDDANTRATETRDYTPDFSGTGDAATSNTYPKNTRVDAGASLGGYFIKDSLWFFGAYDKLKVDRTTEMADGVNAGKPIPQYFDTDLFSAKLTFRAGSSTDVTASVFADPQTNTGSLTNLPLGQSPESYNGERELGGADFALRLNQLLGSRGILTVQYGRHRDRYKTSVADIPYLSDNTPVLLQGGVPVLLGGPGGISPSNNNDSTRDVYAGSLSLFLGKHEVKVGGDYQKDRTVGETYLPGGQSIIIYPCANRSNYRCDLTKAPVIDAAAGRVPVFYRHAYWVNNTVDLKPVKSGPFDAPSPLWSIFAQDEWKVLPNLVVNVGLRYDDQKVFWGDGSLAFDLKNQWSPRIGFAWDFLNDGSSKLYGSWGRFHYALPNDMAVRFSSGLGVVVNYNYDATTLAQDPGAPRRQTIQGIGPFGQPVDEGLKASYQDELTFGVEKAIDATFSVGAKFTYRTLGDVIEDRCDLDPSDPASKGSTCALFNPGSDGPFASGKVGTCNNTGNPYDPTAGECSTPGVAMPAAQRKFTGVEVFARKRVGDRFWAQASYLYSRLVGNYSGAVSTYNWQTNPGANADFDYYQMAENAYGRLELDRPHQFRLDGAYTAPFGLTAALSFYARSGQPVGLTGYFNAGYPYSLNLVERGSYSRDPTDWDADLSLGWTFRVGAVTVTPQVYVFRVFDRQTQWSRATEFNPYGSFVDDPKSPYYGKAGITPGAPGCEGSTVPCTDNPDFGKYYFRTSPRQVRLAVKVSF